MNETDLALLERFRNARDADAFAEIIARHQSLVYSTCLRLLGNPADAQDAAQDCFLRLLRKAGTVQASLGGWLHRCAIDISIDELRSRDARRTREQLSTQMNSHSNPGPNWHELAPHLDAAINDLPDDLRHAVVEHFLERRTQADIAKELGVSAMTVSRRVDAGIEELRKNLKKAGVIASAGALALLLTENAVQAAPTALTASLSKLTVLAAAESGAPAAAASGAAATSGATAASGKLAVIAAVIVAALLAGFGIWKLAGGPRKARQPAPAQQAPAPVAERPNAQAAQDSQQWKPFELTMEYPADAMMIVWVPSIRKAAEGYVDLLGDLLDEGDGMPGMREMLDNAGLLPEAIDGPAVLVGVVYNAAGVTLIPVQDMQALIAKMDAGPDADGIYGRLPSNINGDPVPGKYRVNMLPWKDGYAAFSGDREVLRSFVEAPQKKRYVRLEERVEAFCYLDVPAILKAMGQQGEAGTAANLPLKLAAEVESVDLALKYEDGLRISTQVTVKPGGMIAPYLVPSPGLQGLEPKLPVLDNTVVAGWVRMDRRMMEGLLGDTMKLVEMLMTKAAGEKGIGTLTPLFDGLGIFRGACADADLDAFALETTPWFDGLGVFQMAKPEEFAPKLAQRVEATNKASLDAGQRPKLRYRPDDGTIGGAPNAIQLSRLGMAEGFDIVTGLCGNMVMLAPNTNDFPAVAKVLAGQAQPIAWNAIPPGNNAVIIFDLVPLVNALYGGRAGRLQLPKAAQGWIALKAKEGNTLQFEIYLSRKAIQLLLTLA
ncbi:MAG TPA: sigma-70 family RNA polymerase sigma factor [Phycisphaerae bacterium]|nr:sigma-70 family RNA polymerase sigma factor [Phycisphaerae bacterium]HUW30165.1 sigma-70 family RNA polymerase sigma factor [Planctomycetota bacterium]